MSKRFRAWKIDEVQLLPASVQDYVPCGHLSRLIVNMVRESLDLSALDASYRSDLGQPPFDPRLMTALLLHGYASGIYSSRRVARAAVERADFMMIVAGDAPDFRTISEFRRRHLKALGDLFVQVLRLAETAGLVKLGHVALDGTKIKANASKHKAMSYEHMKKREVELKAEVDRWLEAAEASDAEEDKLYGEKRGGELPDWVTNKQKRLKKIRQAKAALEAAAEAQSKARAEAQDKRIAKGGRKSGKAPSPKVEPDGKAQRNFTDPQSRILKTKDGYIQGWNAQAAVDGEAQIIVAQTLTNSSSDQAQLVPLLQRIKANLGRNPAEVSADAGYCSAANLRAVKRRRIEGYIATGRQKHGTKSATANKPATPGSMIARMRTKLRRAGYRSRYRLRKQIVEPVFGQIKQERGFRQFLMRGIEKVTAEWALICTAHNLVKLARAA
jgi:transposase